LEDFHEPTTLDAALAKPGDDHQHVERRAGQAVKLGDDQGVALGDEVEQDRQLLAPGQ
jgi:hypothetical protein